METGRIALSRRERDRLKLLREFKQKHLTQVEAARWLRLRDRQVRRLLVRIEECGDQAIAHRLRGLPSNRKLAVTLEQTISGATPPSRIRARFAELDTTDENLRTLLGLLGRYGRPLAHKGWQNYRAKAACGRLFPFSYFSWRMVPPRLALAALES
jgi:Helix-turn-helix domain